MMKTLALLATLTIVLLASSGSALASPIIYGYVSDSADAVADSYSRDITLCKEGTSDCLTEKIGIDSSTGLDYEAAPGSTADPLEMYIFDCETLDISGTDNVVITVPDNGGGYYAGPETFLATDSIPMPEMQLAKDCTVPAEENRLTVYTDSPDYYPLETVTITAYYEDDTCSSIVGTTIGFTINETDGSLYYVCDIITNDDGKAICEVGLADDVMSGTWTVYAAASGDGYSNTTTFEVLDCYDNDNDEFAATSCGGDDCDDTDPTSYPGADELCDGIDNDCDGVTDDFSVTCGTDTGACVSGTKTCIEGVWGSCVGSVGTTAEVCGNGIDEDCDGSDTACPTGGNGGGGYATNYCGNLYCDTGEDCVSCPGDCDCLPEEPSEGEQCVPDWSCTAWSDCSPEGSQTRTCEDLNECEGAFTPPGTEQTCVYTAPAGGDTTQGADVTGLVIGDPVMGLYWAAIITMVVLAGGIILWKRKGI